MRPDSLGRYFFTAQSTLHFTDQDTDAQTHGACLGSGDVGSDSPSSSVLSPEGPQLPAPHTFQRSITPLRGVAPAQLLASKTRKWNKRLLYKNGKVGHVRV